jgi:hypothetical protein
MTCRHPIAYVWGNLELSNYETNWSRDCPQLVHYENNAPERDLRLRLYLLSLCVYVCVDGGAGILRPGLHQNQA